MENIEPTIKPYPWTPKELLEREYKFKWKELKICKMRANVMRKQITEAYEILENIRFDYLGDSAFREKIVRAKRGCEDAMTDYLLSDGYWETKIKEHRDMTAEEWKKKKDNMSTPAQSTVQSK